ncbi:Taurine catabolism dioxygenase TauD, TfdA family [Corynebacterium faecale]|uniref:hypothetical protein n=1 Tax=Corynebacterium faecale TaxID=1758466 RepID=UPI0025B3CA39|nr:hypothetical protein [Corynebacterium faecale]WJY92060.1 Taurine catabolism dioxygenase TauD, TfdA family [Corynebacterium faecale]
MSKFLQDLLDESQDTGIAVRELKLPELISLESRILAEARVLGWMPRETRKGSGLLTALIPKEKTEANPSSLSALTGTGRQPLHTDGAHHRIQPDYVLLWSEKENETPTRVWKPSQVPWKSKNGVFVVRGGNDTWLTEATSGFKEIRFDPGCMEPADHLSRALAEYLTNPPVAEIQEIYWDQPKLVFLRNKIVLHGREEMKKGDESRVLKRLIFQGVR